MLSVGSSYGQNIRGPIASPAPGVLDGVYVKEHIPTKKVVPYEYVREADVTWSKRVWSVIDLREKFNHPLYYPLDDINVLGAWNKNTGSWETLGSEYRRAVDQGIRIAKKLSPQDVMQMPITAPETAQ